MAAGEVGRERARVVLVEQPDVRGAERGRAGRVEPAELGAEHARRPGGEPLEAGEDAQQRRLAGAARPERDDDLAGLDREVEPLERDGGGSPES